jgi:predicted transcriptional regulator
MSEKGISQLPIAESNSNTELRIVHESDILEALLSGERKPTDAVGLLAKPLEGRVRLNDDIARIEPLLDANNVAVAVNETPTGDQVCGIITRIDIVRYLTESK